MALPQRAGDPARSMREVVAGNILSLMGRYRVSQKALATHLRISQPALSKRLSAKQAFDLDELEQVAEFFNRSVPDLITEGDMRIRWITSVPAQDGEQMELFSDTQRDWSPRVLAGVGR